MSRMMGRSRAKPVTSEDRKLSKKHLKESIKFNKKHASQHLKLAKHDQKMLRGKGRGKGYY